MPNPVPHVQWKKTMPSWLKKRNRANRSAMISNSVRPFLRGENAELNNYALDAIRKFIRFKELRAIRTSPSALDFTTHEQKAIRNGFFWLVRGMNPELSTRQAMQIVKTNIEKCRKINAQDVTAYIEANRQEFEKNKIQPKQQLYGRIYMLLDGINHMNEALPPPQNSPAL